MTTHPFSNAALLDEFLRVRGSGIAEEEIRRPEVRKQLIRSIAQRLKAQRKSARLRNFPRNAAGIDLKRLQANDID